MQLKETIPSIEDMVSDWSNLFDAPILPFPQIPSENRANLSINLIEEEFKETVKAINNKDLLETADGLGDTLWVVLRAMMEFGLPIRLVMYEIYKSNMSKLCNTREEAHDTIDWYVEREIYTPNQIAYKVHKGKFMVYRVNDNKVLKSKYYKPVNFRWLLTLNKKQ